MPIFISSQKLNGVGVVNTWMRSYIHTYIQTYINTYIHSTYIVSKRHTYIVFLKLLYIHACIYVKETIQKEELEGGKDRVSWKEKRLEATVL